ncbi:MAG TPA: SAVED domain-containing protein [Burkholderiales bacterium]|nr:SAVED domain-containing protein [Burkholderiales bacterium]
MGEASKKNVRLGIPERVRAQLWVAAAGHCEFNCCNKPLDRNVLTKQDVFLGEHAHIIGDSVHGPRGDRELSKKLAQDASNIMLVCRDCHRTIDRLEDDYPVELLRRMKHRHETRIQRLYELDECKESVPVVLRHPIKRIHVPQFTDRDVQAAILTNSDFCHAPAQHLVQLDYRSRAAREGDRAYWDELVRQMRDDYAGQMHLAARDGHPAHLSIFAFAPMPLNMQLGALIGNKVEASSFQWDRVFENWNFRLERRYERQTLTHSAVPRSDGRELSLVISLSGEVNLGAAAAAAGELPMVRFGVPRPTPELVENADDIRHFRSKLTALMAEVRNQGYQVVHVFPAMPLSLAVEFGRQLLPKADPTMRIWDYQYSRFVHTLDIQV